MPCAGIRRRFTRTTAERPDRGGWPRAVLGVARLPELGGEEIDERANPRRHLVPLRIDGEDVRARRLVVRQHDD